MDPKRRMFIQSVLAGVGCLGFSPMARSAGLFFPQHYASAQDTAAFWAQPRTLNLYRPERGEHIHVCYWRDGQLVRAGYLEICRILRDTHENKAVAMDVRLLDLLRGQQGWLELAYGYREPYHVNSGYRTAHTNALTEGAVKNSYHTKGMAVDGKYPDLPVAYQGQLIAAFQGGGVGFYFNTKHNFIHADVGRLRYWRG